MLINKNTFSNKLLNKYIYWSGIITLLFILITSYVNYVNKHFPEQIYITEQSDTSINLSLPVTSSDLLPEAFTTRRMVLITVLQMLISAERLLL